MARISFRQGIVDYPKNPSSGEQEFLAKSGDSVNLIVNTGTSAEPIIITFIDGDTDYLYSQTKNESPAWTDCPPGPTYYLYWEMDIDTGIVSFGKTTLEPIISAREPAPARRVQGQMWFDTRSNKWVEYSGVVWIPVLRVFAAKYLNGSSFESMSIAANNSFAGTQIGSLSNGRSAKNIGSLVFNTAGKAIKSGIRDQFFTTEDKFLTGVPTGASLRISNQVVTGTALCPIAAYQVVEFTDFDEICPANPAKQGERLFGIVEEDVNASELVTITTEGIIFNEAWNWSANNGKVNTALYVDSLGNLTKKKQPGGRPPVAIVVGKKEIYFAPRLFPQVTVEIGNGNGNGGGLTAAQEAQLNDATTNIAINTGNINSLNTTTNDLVGRVETLEDDNTALMNDIGNKLDIAGGTMTGDLILNSAPTAELQAANKGYVDTVREGPHIDFTAGSWSVVGTNNIFQITASTHGLPLNIYYDVIVFDSSGNRVSVSYNVNRTTGLITISSAGQPFAGTVRIK